VLLLVARRSSEGEILPVHEEATITRIGRGVDRTGMLSPPGVQATLDALRTFAARARDFGATQLAAVGTSALRDARNAALFLRPAEEILGAPVEVISGTREAQLTFAGAVQGLSIEREPVSVVDIGGGSTEVVRGRDSTVEHGVSLDVGSVRLTERHIHHDPPRPEEVERIAADVSAALRARAPFLAPPMVGIAGTVTTLAAIHGRVSPYDPARIHGMELSQKAVADLADDLASRPSEDRTALVGLDARRADVIIAGAIILREAMRHAGADRVLVSHGGVRYGRAAEMLPRLATPEPG
jgi:exopolyphosphatase / guanosine-5'-triphosphate,3'-diphosphate pyrophosphatase